MFTRHSLGPGCGYTEFVVTPCLTDAVLKGVKVQGRLLQVGHVSSCIARVGVLGSQLFRATENTETGFSGLISIAFITAWQSFIKEGACQG